jgi:hypothetical protein
MDDLQVLHRVDAVLDVDDVGVVKGAHDVKDPVDGGDVGEEGVAEALAGGGALDQARDVDDLEEGGRLGLGLVERAEPAEALVGDVDARVVGVDCAKGEVLGRDGQLRERVEERRLADVGEANDADLFFVRVER